MQRSRHLAPSPDGFSETKNRLGTVAPLSGVGGAIKIRTLEVEMMLFLK